MSTCSPAPRRRLLITGTALLALALAACGSSGEPEASATAAEVTAEPTEEPSPSRTPDPDAPDLAVFSEGDEMAHTMCELWTTALDDPDELRDVADDVAWYGEQADNEFMQNPLNAGTWGEEDPGGTNVLCRWNGYEVQDGSPADLLA